MESTLRRIDAGLPALCRWCGQEIHFASYEGAGFAWHHVLSRDVGHDPAPVNGAAKEITERYMAGER